MRLEAYRTGCVRSPDGKQLAVLLREKSRRNSFVIFSSDPRESWSDPRELQAALAGDPHADRYAPDGRLFISFRDRHAPKPHAGRLGRPLPRTFSRAARAGTACG